MNVLTLGNVDIIYLLFHFVTLLVILDRSFLIAIKTFSFKEENVLLLLLQTIPCALLLYHYACAFWRSLIHVVY